MTELQFKNQKSICMRCQHWFRVEKINSKKTTFKIKQWLYPEQHDADTALREIDLQTGYCSIKKASTQFNFYCQQFEMINYYSVMKTELETLANQVENFTVFCALSEREYRHKTREMEDRITTTLSKYLIGASACSLSYMENVSSAMMAVPDGMKLTVYKEDYKKHAIVWQNYGEVKIIGVAKCESLCHAIIAASLRAILQYNTEIKSGPF
jgi:hypothetical protein